MEHGGGSAFCWKRRANCIKGLMLLAVIGCVVAGGMQSAYAVQEKIAVIAIDPKLEKMAFNLNSPRILAEINWYKNNGYRIASVKGDVEGIRRALLDKRVKAITYVGHGDMREGGKYVSSLAYLSAKSWRSNIQAYLTNKYMQEGLSFEEAKARAERETHNFGLERVVNYSCYSLVDTSIAELFVKPGGTYWGSEYKYTGNPLAFIYFIWGSASFTLDLYRVPARATGNPVGLSVVLLMDGSGSMRGSKLEAAKEAVRQTVKDNLKPDSGVEMAVMVFAGCSSAKEVQKFTRSADAILSKLDEITAGGGTPIEHALRKAADMLKKRGSAIRALYPDLDWKGKIVLLSDGGESCNGNPVEAAKTIHTQTVAVSP